MQLENALQTIRDAVEVSRQWGTFFLLDVPGSGCRAVANGLNQHPAICCIKHGHFSDVLERELFKAFAHYNAEIPKQGNWSRHRKEGTDPITPELFTYNREEISGLVTEAVHIMFSHAAVDKHPVLVGDYTPENIQCLSSLSQLFPGARFLHVIRDVRDIVIGSWSRTIDSLTGTDKEQSITSHAETVARTWFRDITKARAVAKNIGDRYLEVQYEKIWNNPDKMLRQIIDFLMTDLKNHSTQEVEVEFFNTGLLKIDAPGVWKDNMDLLAQERIKASCGGLMAKMGYF